MRSCLTIPQPANPEIHRRTTAEEIWTDAGGDIDVLVSGVGTGGTITGVGEVLTRATCRVVAVEPAGAAVLSGCRPGSSSSWAGRGSSRDSQQGVVDEVVPVTEEQAMRTQLQPPARGLRPGCPVAPRCSRRCWLPATGHDRKRFVVILPDGGERYATNEVFAEIMRAVSRP
jgi:cysteine synthase A